MNTVLTKIDMEGDISSQIREGAALIREGKLVAFPTETVYGLGADALNASAAARIYEAKGRPSDNPLIVHICELEQVDQIARDIPDAARRVMEAFWPGPLTVILPKKPCVPDGTTGGLSTVAIRMPSHPVARTLIRESGRLIAAPSANTSGRPSPTRAEHVYEDMKGRIPLILDGGPVGIGIESTIIDMSGEVPMILRPGYISPEQLSRVAGQVRIDPAVAGKVRPDHVVAKAPGMKYRHYAPKGQMTLVEGAADKVIDKIRALAGEKAEEGYLVGILATDETIGCYRDIGGNLTVESRICPGQVEVMDSIHDKSKAGAVICRSIGSRRNPESVAAQLYDALRECDDMGLDYIYSESFFEEGLGDAIMNRMLKAAGYHLISL